MMRRPAEAGSTPRRASRFPISGLIWVGFLVAASLLFGVNPVIWAIAVAASAVVLALILSSSDPPWHPSIDRGDLLAVGAFYVVVVGLIRVAFVVFTPERTLGFWLTFGAALLLGVVGPIVQQVWIRQRGMRSVGITRLHLPEALTLGLILALAQFARVVWGHGFGELADWAPLAAASLVIGFFEVVFFRGFIQTRLEASFGTGPGVGGAAVLYAVYHLGYGVGLGELWVVLGLGVLYGIAYRLVESIWVLWPLVAPLHAFFYLETFGITLSTAALLGLAGLAVAMAASTWWAYRRVRRRFAQVVPTEWPDPSSFDVPG